MTYKELQLVEHEKSVKSIGKLCNGTHIIEPKIDGVRTEFTQDAAYSRYENRKGFAKHQIESLLNFLATANISLDGEFDTNVTDAEGKLLHHTQRRYKTVSIMNQKNIQDRDLPKLVFWVFDLLTPQNLWTLQERKQYLTKIIPTINSICPFEVKLVPHLLIKTEQEFKVALSYFLKEGFEGVVMKKANGLYKGGNRGDWVAYKVRHTSDVPIIRIETGRKGKKNEFRCGSAVVQTPRGEAEIGTGFNDKIRKWLYDNMANVAGLVIEIEHEGFANETGGDLVNASFVTIRTDKPRWGMSF